MRPDQNHPERSCRDSHRVVIAMDEPRQASAVNARPGGEGVFSLIYIPLHKNLCFFITSPAPFPKLRDVNQQPLQKPASHR